MKKMKWSVIAFAVAAATSQIAVASQQSEAKGFVEGSSLDVYSRVLYFNRDFRNHASSSNGKSGYSEDLGLGLKAIYESGFTQGTVGFGVDAYAMQGIKLDSGKGRNGNGLFPTKGDGRAQDNYSEAGAAVKARISNTTLKYGDQFVDVPVFSMDDSRLLPESTTGFFVTSEELQNLELHAGHFTALNSMHQTARDSANNGRLRSIDLIGGRYHFTENLSAAYYYADAELGHKGVDRMISKKQYVNVSYLHPIADDQSLSVDFNAYSTRYDYKTPNKDTSEQGIRKNNVQSLAVAYNIGAHTFTVARQQVEGNNDMGYDYGYDGGGSVYLANDIQVHGFHKKGERSYQLRYDLDMAEFGVPGLTLMARYVRGSHIADSTGRHQGKNWESNFEAQYVVQEGPAKDLSLRVRQAVYRANDAALSMGSGPHSDINEVRFIVEYPLSVL